MATSTLKKITTRAKQIRKKHPGKSWRNAVKDAGREFRTGKMAKKKARPRRKAARKRSRPRKVGAFRPTTGRRGPRETVIRTRARVAGHKRKPRRKRGAVTRYVNRPRRRRVGQSSATSGLMPVVLIGGLVLLAYALLRKQGQPAPVTQPSGLVSTGNQYRDATAQRILAYAAAAGIAADAIAKLIQSLNRASDQDVNQIEDAIDSGAGIPWDYMAGLN